MTARRFIAHRGVHLGCTIAGENSLEAVALARRAGFACIETDVRLSSDGELVVMHDETLNRTAALADGTPLPAPVRVDEVPLGRLRSEYRLKARDPEARTGIPTLEEYLRACVEAHLLPFIELKLDGPTELVQRVLELADDIVGRGGYVMTSNGRVNRTIRRLGIHDVPLMDILYQAPSFADVTALGEVTVAISATRYARAEHLGFVDPTTASTSSRPMCSRPTSRPARPCCWRSTRATTPSFAPPTARGSRCALPRGSPSAACSSRSNSRADARCDSGRSASGSRVPSRGGSGTRFSCSTRRRRRP